MNRLALPLLLLALAAGCLSARPQPPETEAARGRALLARARQRWERGDWPGALRETEAARQVFLAIDDLLGQARALNDRAALALALGERDAAKESIEEAMLLGLNGGAAQASPLQLAIGTNLARIAVEAEPPDLAFALPYAEWADEQYAQEGNAPGQAGTQLLLARAGLAAGGEAAPEKARRHLDQAARLAERSGDPLLLARVRLARGRFLTGPEPEAARADLEASLALYKGEGDPPRPENPPGILAALVALARWHEEANEPEAAAAAWQRAAGVAAHLPWHPLAAECPPRADAP